MDTFLQRHDTRFPNFYLARWKNHTDSRSSSIPFTVFLFFPNFLSRFAEKNKRGESSWKFLAMDEVG